MKSIIRKCLALAALTGLALTAHAGGPYKVYPPYWVWNNNFNNEQYAFNFGTGTVPQWGCSFNKSTSGPLKGFPASIRGQHYGLRPTSDTKFPRKVSTVSNIPAKFSYNASGTIHGDFAYDLFFRWDTAAANPQLEVMVWGRNDSYPIGTRIVANAITEGGVTYDLWFGNNQSAGYHVYTFIPVRSRVPSAVPTGSSTINVNLKNFLNKLNGRGYYSSAMYLDVIEGGFEIGGGNGTIRCDWFSCDAY